MQDYGQGTSGKELSLERRKLKVIYEENGAITPHTFQG
jgi:hypothetical protein